MEEIPTTRHKGGYKARGDELMVVDVVAMAGKFDEAWFGAIREFKTENGKVVHEVWDHQQKHWLTFRFAVDLLDQGTFSPWFLSNAAARVWFRLLRKLSIIKPAVEKASSWTLRMVSSDRSKLMRAKKRLAEWDMEVGQYRDLKIIRTKSGLHCLDIHGSGLWDRSLERHVCYENNVAFDVIFTNDGKDFRHTVYNGKQIAMSVKCDLWMLSLPPEDIVNMPAGAGSDE